MPPQTPTEHRQDFTTPKQTITSPDNGKSEGFKSIVSTILLFVLAPIFALFMILFVFQSYVVDGSSMEPTLQNGNRVFILKLPKTVASLQNKMFIPTRHEVIVFKKPSDPSTQLIKRVIGLPGDRVIVKDGQITIFNSEHPEGFNPDADTQYGPTLEPTSGIVDITVGQNELFVCGDNRAPGGSLDSRTGVGLVPVENIVGRLWIRYFPLSEFKVFASLKYDQQFVLNLLHS
jgi:signal peptidase I